MKSLRFTAILPVAGILLLCVFTFYSGDDICYRNELARYSVLKKAWLQYMFWDGRSLSIPSLVQLTALKYFSAPLTSLIWTVSFLGAVVMVLKLLQLEFQVQINTVSFGMLSVILWLGMWKLIPDILYWPTGGWYCMMALIALIWIYFLSKDLQMQKFHPGRVLFIFIFSIVCGNNSHNIILPLLFIALEKLVFSKFVLKEKKSTQYLLSSIAGLIIGASVVLFAPGNDVRMHAISWSGFNSEFFWNCCLVFARYCYWLLSLFILLFCIAWTGRKKIMSVLSSSHIDKAPLWIVTIHQHKYLFAALLSVVVFTATSFFAVPRTAIFFGIFITIYILQQFKVDFNPDSKRFYPAGMILALGCSVIIFYQAVCVNALKNRLKARENIFEMNKGKDVIVDAIPDSMIPFAFTFVDISSDTTYWVNHCLALDKELKTVRTNRSLQSP